MTSGGAPMFRHRNSAQKPDEELIRRFQHIYPNIIFGRSGDQRPQFHPSKADKSYSTLERLNGDTGVILGEARSTISSDQAPATLLEINFPPLWLNPTSAASMSFASQYLNINTPILEQENALNHSPAHDLYAPTLGLNMMTPISLSSSISCDMEDFNKQYVSKPTCYINPIVQQESYAPRVFMHRDMDSATMDDIFNDDSPHELSSNQMPRMPNTIGTAEVPKATLDGMPFNEGEKLRYITTLQAPTAMIGKDRNAPVSYLNKGQVYNITMVDLTPPMIRSDLIQYRTFVRISFDDEEQKSNAAACWQLWKEGRGLREIRQRGRTVFAFEYVGQHREGSDDHDQLQIQVEQKSFDGFCITWAAPAAVGTSKCGILVRFNFLSTDFTRSKGVKGLPVRLCAKTQVLSPGDDFDIRELEICYCKIKVFRDHGAERKLSNDTAHIQKTIEKLKQQITQAEMCGGLGKRKRGTRATTKRKGFDQSTKTSPGGATDKISSKNDLRAKVALMQDMFLSARPVSILALRGNKEDDPDLYPVSLQTGGDLVETEIPASPIQVSMLDSFRFIPHDLRSLKNHQSTAAAQNIASRYKMSPGAIEAVDIDRFPKLLTEELSKPIAYFLSRSLGKEQKAREQRFAVCLTERMVRDLTKQICEKHDLEPAREFRILPMDQTGLQNAVDDDFIR